MKDVEKFYNDLEDVYKYFQNYTLQEIYDSLIASGLFDLSNKEDLDFVESFAYKIYYGVQNYNRTHITWHEISNALKSLSEVVATKRSPQNINQNITFMVKQ